MAEGRASPWFMSVWLLFWSLGVGVLSSLVGTQGGLLWLFLFTHGGAEIGVGWLTAGMFARATEEALGDPSLEASLSGVTARWQSRRRATLLLIGAVVVGGLIGLLLAGGTWLPVVQSGTIQSALLALVLSAAWGVIGWRWLLALRRMIGLLGSVELSATFDRLTATHRRLGVEVIHELPMAGLRVRAEGAWLTLTAGAETVRLPCATGLKRDRLADALKELAINADSPGAQGEVPPTLAALMSRSAPQAER
jgi:hypothetical protein